MLEVILEITSGLRKHNTGDMEYHTQSSIASEEGIDQRSPMDIYL